jgi:hypothetical protein
MLWSHLKYGLMANFVPRHVRHLDAVVRDHLCGMGKNAALIKALRSGSRLRFLDKKLAI